MKLNEKQAEEMIPEWVWIILGCIASPSVALTLIWMVACLVAVSFGRTIPYGGWISAILLTSLLISIPPIVWINRNQDREARERQLKRDAEEGVGLWG